VKIGLATGLLAISLAGCGSTNWGFPYRPAIQQGNWITSEQIAKLEVGMTRDQVRFVLGTPTLEDAFHADRWDYPYYNQPGYGKDELRKFTVWFQDDKLTHWSGDQQPNRQPFQKVDSGREAIPSKSSADKDAQKAASPGVNSSAAPNQPGLDNPGTPPAVSTPANAPAAATPSTNPSPASGDKK
jgi:outer membrane protein assembly factor BamE